jgi:lysophospholipase
MLRFCADYRLPGPETCPGVSYRAGVVDTPDFRLLVHSWEQPGATRNLLLVHGYFDHSGLYGHLVAAGLELGCNVLIFDQPGHGLSSGSPGVITDFRQYGQAIADVMAATTLPTLPWWVIAQSMGCAALVEYARGNAGTWSFAATILLAPLVRPAGWAGISAAYFLVGRLVDSVARRYAVNSSDPDFVDFVQSDPLQSRRVPVAWVRALRRWQAALPRRDLGVGPTLVVQGDADTTVDWRYNLPVIGRLFPGSSIEMLMGAGHHLANESPALRGRYLRAVEEYLAGAV